MHLGGTLDEISRSEWGAWSGHVVERPFVLLVQPSLFDDTRAPAGKHIAWAYCHVPNGSTEDLTERIEAQVERFAPGFRELVLARNTIGPAGFEARNRNLVGGDLNGGAMDLGQLFARPTLRSWSTPLDGVYLCSPRPRRAEASTECAATGRRAPRWGLEDRGRRPPRSSSP